MKIGSVDYLPKPFTPAQVKHITQRIAEIRRLQQNIDALRETLGKTNPEVDLAGTHSPEETVKSPIKSQYRLPGTFNIQPSEVGIGLLLARKPAAEIEVGNIGPVHIPGELFKIQAGVVQTPVRFQASGQLPLLIGVREQTVFVGETHLPSPMNARRLDADENVVENQGVFVDRGGVSEVILLR